MKKLLVIGLGLMLLVTGCGKGKGELLDMSVNDIVDKIYEGISDKDMPGLASMDITEENMAYYLGIDDVKIEEGVASEPMMGSLAWSVVVIKVADGVDVQATKNKIEKNVDRAKWICVDAEEVIVESRDNVIVLIMMDEVNKKIATKIKNNFNNL